jgi:hypothetical protein
MKIEEHKQSNIKAGMWPNMQPSNIRLFQAKTNLNNHFFVWKAEPVSQEIHQKQLSKGLDTRYACHGFTVGSYKLRGGPYTPYGDGIDVVLEDEFTPISTHDLTVGDVITWRDQDGDISHTARISEVYRDKEGRLLDNTRLATKNGAGILRENMRLSTLKLKYGSLIEFYREKDSQLQLSL